jgi:hypothetical protein
MCLLGGIREGLPHIVRTLTGVMILQATNGSAEGRLEHRVEIRSYDSVFRAAWSVLNDSGIDHILNSPISR